MRHVSNEDPINPIDFGPLPNGLNHRQTAEEEASRDYIKSNRQLLADAHDEILRGDRDPEYNLAHAFKRIASLMARASDSSEKAASENIKMQTSIEALTKGLWTLTRVLIGLAVIQILLAALQVFTK